MSFFVDIRIISQIIFKEFINFCKIRIKNPIDGHKSAKEMNKNKYEYKNNNRFKCVSDLNVFKDKFASFAYVKDGKIYFTDSIKTNFSKYINSLILTEKNGDDISLLVSIENNRLYYLFDSRGSYYEFVNLSEIKYIKYTLTKDAEMKIDIDGVPSVFLGTILRRHKLSGNGYNREHTNHFETITNLMKFKPVKFEALYTENGEKVTYDRLNNRNLDSIKIAYDVINDKLLFIEMFNFVTTPNLTEIKAEIIKSVEYKLDDSETCTGYVILHMQSGKTINLYAPDGCKLHIN